MSETDDKLLTAAEVATRLRLSAPTIRRLAHQGVIPAVRVGDGDRRPLRFRQRDLDNALKEAHRA